MWAWVKETEASPKSNEIGFGHQMERNWNGVWASVGPEGDSVRI